MNYVIVDTNIFIDLLSINVLEKIFELNHRICTTDFVINEIYFPGQKEHINNFIINNQLIVFDLSFEDIQAATRLKTNKNLKRIADKSVLWKAFNLKCIILTGDKNLRLEAESYGLEVHEVLWILQTWVELKIISRNHAIMAIEKLKSINPSLPQVELISLIHYIKNLKLKI